MMKCSWFLILSMVADLSSKIVMSESVRRETESSSNGVFLLVVLLCLLVVLFLTGVVGEVVLGRGSLASSGWVGGIEGSYVTVASEVVFFILFLVFGVIRLGEFVVPVFCICLVGWFCWRVRLVLSFRVGIGSFLDCVDVVDLCSYEVVEVSDFVDVFFVFFCFDLCLFLFLFLTLSFSALRRSPLVPRNSHMRAHMGRNISL